MKKILSSVILTTLCCCNIYGQQVEKIRNHNLIFNGDIAFGNLYSTIVSSGVSGAINGLLNTPFFENSG